MDGRLEDDLNNVGVEIKELKSKQERVEAALEGRGSYLGTTDHVSVRCATRVFRRTTEGTLPWCWVLLGHSRCIVYGALAAVILVLVPLCRGQHPR